MAPATAVLATLPVKAIRFRPAGTLPNKRFDAKVLVYESCRGTGNYSGLDSTLVLVFGKMPVRAGSAVAVLPTLLSRYSIEQEL